MKVKTALLWSVINEKEHASLSGKERKIEALMPLVSTLFPGINYYSITGFHSVMKQCVIPALKKQHPELFNASDKKVDLDQQTEISEILPSRGYEWQDDIKWKNRFKKLMAA